MHSIARLFAGVLFLSLALAPHEAGAQDASAKLQDAQRNRTASLLKAIGKLDQLLEQMRNNETKFDAATTTALRRWMHIAVPNEATENAISDIRSRLAENYNSAPEIAEHPSPDPNGCKPDDWACALGNQIYLTEKWGNAPQACRNTVLVHEYFHIIGLPEVKKPATTKKAIGSPDYLAGLVCELSLGRTDTRICDFPCS